jgi:penicillin-binding protein 1A
MTGGSLPAMTWHNIMAYAHQGDEVKQLPGVVVPQIRQPQAFAEVKSKNSEPPPPPRPALLTKRGAELLVRVERLMDDANRALGPTSTISPVNPARPRDKQAAAPRKGDALAVSLEGRAFGGHN